MSGALPGAASAVRPPMAATIACNFHAVAMPRTVVRFAFGLATLVAAWVLAGPATAEKADRHKPMVVEADRPGTVDLQRQAVVFNGNVAITQGTMSLRAERIEMRETSDGFRVASAIGSAGAPATWRQRRDGVDETIEGAADRIEYDGRNDTLRLVGNGVVRRLRGGTVADEITGALILWDNTAEVFKVEGGAVSASNPSGRVRAVLSPRTEPSPGPGASAPSAPLTPSRSLGARP
jgi:lipopolysaccharide export system protein LptA